MQSSILFCPNCIIASFTKLENKIEKNEWWHINNCGFCLRSTAELMMKGTRNKQTSSTNENTVTFYDNIQREYVRWNSWDETEWQGTGKMRSATGVCHLYRLLLYMHLLIKLNFGCRMTCIYWGLGYKGLFVSRFRSTAWKIGAKLLGFAKNPVKDPGVKTSSVHCIA